ncbi:MAG TPA: flagellar motor switch/type III secretory pathway protein, partial [Isosphaeraceae bacterium]|nr:flagellar motor switch/type III secretory pathway protein [Isosphaeraceae bacterium]
MSADALDTERPDSNVEVDPANPADRPQFSRRQVRLRDALQRLDSGLEIQDLLDWLSEPAEFSISVGRPEVLNRPAGLGRAGMIAVLAWPRLSTRLGLGLEMPLAHVLVDRLLGFDRQPGEERLQITPVEWGILSFGIAGTLSHLAQSPGPLGDWDLTIDRVGSEAFSVDALGGITTIRWPVSIEGVEGSLRLWVPNSVVDAWLEARPESSPAVDLHSALERLGNLASEWRAEAGSIPLTDGLSALREGVVLPIAGSPLTGSIESPSGPVLLVLRDADGRLSLPAQPEPQSGAARLVVHPPVRR